MAGLLAVPDVSLSLESFACLVGMTHTAAASVAQQFVDN